MLNAASRYTPLQQQTRFQSAVDSVDLTLYEKGEATMIGIDPRYTIGYLKQALYRTIVDIPPEQQVLTFGGKQYGDHHFISDIAPADRSTLCVERVSIAMEGVEQQQATDETSKPVPGVVTIAASASAEKRSNSMEGVEQPRKALKKKPVSHPFAAIGSEYSNSIRRLRSSTVQPELPLCVQAPDGKLIALADFKDTDNILKIKEALAPLAGIPVRQQILIYKHVAYNDNTRLLGSISPSAYSQLRVERKKSDSREVEKKLSPPETQVHHLVAIPRSSRI